MNTIKKVWAETENFCPGFNEIVDTISKVKPADDGIGYTFYVEPKKLPLYWSDLKRIYSYEDIQAAAAETDTAADFIEALSKRTNTDAMGALELIKELKEGA